MADVVVPAPAPPVEEAAPELAPELGSPTAPTVTGGMIRGFAKKPIKISLANRPQ
jgi:hypothetical protein